MIQIALMLGGLVLISRFISTDDERAKARQDIKHIEPLCIAIIVIGGGFLIYSAAN